MDWSKCYKVVFEWNRKKSLRNFIQIYKYGFRRSRIHNLIWRIYRIIKNTLSGRYKKFERELLEKLKPSPWCRNCKYKYTETDPWFIVNGDHYFCGAVFHLNEYDDYEGECIDDFYHGSKLEKCLFYEEVTV